MDSDFEKKYAQTLDSLSKLHMRKDTQEEDWEGYFSEVRLLASNRPNAIKIVADGIQDHDELERILAIDLAGALMNPVEDGQEEDARKIISILTRLSQLEMSDDCLEAIATALGYAYMLETKDALMELSKNKNDDVRLAATSSMSSLTIFDDEDVITRLQALSHDSNEDVRDWANFGLKSD